MSTKKKREQRNAAIAKWVGIGFLVLLFASVLWSMWLETLKPLLRSGDTAGFINNLIGLPIILLTTGLIIYGGIRVILASVQTLTDETLRKNLGIIRQGEEKSQVRQARRQNAMLFFRAWTIGAGLMFLGFLFMGLGGWFINR